MIRKDRHRFADGSYKTQIRITYGYRDIQTGKVKQKTVKSFGYLEDQADPEAFLAMVKEEDAKLKKERKIELRTSGGASFLEDESSKTYNFGYRYIDAVYDFIELDSFFDGIEYRGKTPLKDIFRFLTLQRIMNPDSKRAQFQSRDAFYGFSLPDLELPQLYRSLSVFYAHREEIQNHINSVIERKIGRNKGTLFLDVTNFMTTIDFNDDDMLIPYEMKDTVNPNLLEKDKKGEPKVYEVTDSDGNKVKCLKLFGLRKKGVSKEHSLDPIVSMGLLIDDKALPVRMEISSGNTADSKELVPILKQFVENKGKERLVVIADKGLNSGANISYLLNNGCGYIFSQIVRGKKGTRYKKDLLDPQGYTNVNDDYRYKLKAEDYTYTDKDGNEKTAKRQVLYYYSRKDAERERIKRNEKIKKAKDAIASGIVGLDHSFRKYVSRIKYDKKTGEVDESAEVAVIDQEKADEDAKYDGYFCIITSEMDYTEEEIRTKYHGLWRIEESFRISKTDLLARPIFLSDSEHIQAHFLICYVALLVLRLLQHKLSHGLSVERIQRALRMCGCSVISKGVVHVIRQNTYRDFDVKTSESGKKYISLYLKEMEEETVGDYRMINGCLGGQKLASMVQMPAFKRFLEGIKFTV